jgi:hypothetical protein
MADTKKPKKGWDIGDVMRLAGTGPKRFRRALEIVDNLFHDGKITFKQKCVWREAISSVSIEHSRGASDAD